MRAIQHLLLLLVLAIVLGANELNDTIKCLDDYVLSLQPFIDPNLFPVLQKAFPDTMKRTVQHFNLTPSYESTYIITGDIEAMWLRDSTNQFTPYIRMPKECPNVRALARGLLHTQSEFILVDAYTNAFKKFETTTATRPSYLKDRSETLILGIPVDLCRERQFATPTIWERKFQIDSLASFLRLTHEYVARYQLVDFLDLRFFKAIKRILSVINEQSKDRKEEQALGKNYYTFYRNNQELPDGKIAPSSRTGMVKTGFRPSDSPNSLPYNIPGNAMMTSYLQLVANEVLAKVETNSVWKSRAVRLADQMRNASLRIRLGIKQFGTVVRDGVKMFAYEVDGMGNTQLYDDANLPSLLSLPYMGFVAVQDPIYQQTRRFILSSENIYFYANGSISGIGSSHTSPRYIWPLALITQILTSQSDQEIRSCLSSLLKSANNDLMHESFSVDNPALITRDWFDWANSFFGEMLAHLVSRSEQLLLEQ